MVSTESLRRIAAVCMVTVTAAVCAFVKLKTQNDRAVVRETARIADAVEAKR